jgi:hypothetical protein
VKRAEKGTGRRRWYGACKGIIKRFNTLTTARYLLKPIAMKTALFSFVAALGLFAATSSQAATASFPPLKDRREIARIERERALDRARREAAEREQQRRLAEERARLEAQRRAEQQRAAERARWEAQHRYDGRGHR